MIAAGTSEAIAKRFSSGFSSHVTFSVTERMVARFAALTGDMSSLHTSEEFARRSIYRRPVVHGMLPLSYLAFCPDLCVEGYVAALTMIGGHFAGPVYVGDALDLMVTLNDAKRAPHEAAFSFRIARVQTHEVATTGDLVLSYRAAPRRSHASPDAGDHAALLTRALTPRSLAIEEINKGDGDTFDFDVTERVVQAFRALLLEGVHGERRQEALKNSGLEHADLVGVVLFSTLVGMRLPGETATFLDFTAQIVEPLQVPGRYRLDAKVAHVSRGASLVRTDVSIAPIDGGRGTIAGKVATLVTKPARARRTMKDLQAVATDLGLKGKVALITGASGGIGETTAKLFALFGAKVILNYRRSKDDAERIVREIEDEGGSAIALQADISDVEQLRALVDTAVAQYGGIDILVNNAVRDFRSIAYADLSWNEIQADIDVTVKGAFHCCKFVMPHMLARGGGKIVNISSVYADDPPPDQLKYVVSKAALEGLARGLAAELAGCNIQVNTVVPSFVETEIASQIYDGIRKKKAQESPMRRNATPEDVAHAVLFLASSFSSYTTGQRILVTGGGAPYL